MITIKCDICGKEIETAKHSRQEPNSEHMLVDVMYKGKEWDKTTWDSRNYSFYVCDECAEKFEKMLGYKPDKKLIKCGDDQVTAYSTGLF